MGEKIHSAHEYGILFQQGDERALDYFMTEFYSALAFFSNQWVKNRAIAEEIASNAFVTTWKHHRKLGDYYVIRAYLYKTVWRASQRSFYNEQNRLKTYHEAQIPKVNLDTPFENLVRSETYRLLQSALNKLPKGSQTVVRMHFMEGKRLVAIAKELNLHVSTVKSQKAAGLKALRKHFLRSAITLLSLISVKTIFTLF